MSKKTKRERLARLERRKVYIICGAVGVVCVIGIVGLLMFLKSQSDGKDDSGSTPEEKAAIEASVGRVKNDGKLRDQATEELEKNNNTARAAELYDQAIQDAKEVRRKIELYLDLANTYYSAGKIEEALAAGKKAEAQSSDKFLAADWLGRAYEDQKQYPEAIAYYQLAQKSVSSPQNEFQFDKGYYDRAIARAKQSQQENK